MASAISEHTTPPKTTAGKTSMTMTIASILPTPPSSPSPSSCKAVVIPIASAATLPTTLPTTLPSQPVEHAQVLSQLKYTPAANATSTTNTRSTPRTTNNEPLAAGRPPSRTLTALKRDLRIDGWRCGAQTLGETECRHSILKENKILIDAQLVSMTDLTRACPDFEFGLLKLVMLVHYYQHDAGRPKERRIEARRLAFPPGG
ncbi:hypothetical protein BCR34DRAFT_670129 [Clohesyomyces aquaticus]|uniref:Uncharacterized protein n=1 Tax=Clohesyomyces aquaticus TaxID=1231657 RepID=A0A1Y1XZH9_9PLEO|nr:hypothetical protein BCR34DRAFT_670129 [Clohesyomyces aquaticus]